MSKLTPHMIIPRSLSGWSTHPAGSLLYCRYGLILTHVFVRSMPARTPPDNVQFPGRQYSSDQAIASEDERARGTHGCAIGLDGFTGQRTEETLASSEDPPIHDDGTGSGRPNLPGWLASARAQEADETQPRDVVPLMYITGPFSDFQVQPGTPVVPLHSTMTPYEDRQQQQHQHGEPYQSSSMAEPAPRAPAFHELQQQTDQQQMQDTMATNNRQPLLSNSKRPPSIQSSSSTPANFTRSSLPAQPLYESPHQTTLQTHPSPNMSSYYQEQSSLVSPTTYVQPPTDRSAPCSHILQPQNYWSNLHQASTLPPSPSTFNPQPSLPETITRPTSPALYDRARGAVVAVATAAMQLPHPHPTSLATQSSFSEGAGYYVRAAGTLRKFPG